MSLKIVEECLNTGWHLECKDAKQKTYYLIPPDRRQEWAAEWTPIAYGVIFILIPQYALTNPRGRPPPGMPARFGKRRMF